MSTDGYHDGAALAHSDPAPRGPTTGTRHQESLRMVGLQTREPALPTEDEGVWPASLVRVERPYVRCKNAVERVVGSVLFVVSLPLMFVIAALIRSRLGPGVLYTQERVGRDGVTFRIVKFRTMDTDRRSNELTFVGGERRTSHTTDTDPRHTGLGSILRSTSLDELPQLWNVDRGEMVLVGPRPELASVVDEYALWAHPRHRLKPGITGMWQVSEFRHELLHENMDVDLEYIEALSLRTDLRIMLRTLYMPFNRTGR